MEINGCLFSIAAIFDIAHFQKALDHIYIYCTYIYIYSLALQGSLDYYVRGKVSRKLCMQKLWKHTVFWHSLVNDINFLSGELWMLDLHVSKILATEFFVKTILVVSRKIPHEWCLPLLLRPLCNVRHLYACLLSPSLIWHTSQINSDTCSELGPCVHAVCHRE